MKCSNTINSVFLSGLSLVSVSLSHQAYASNNDAVAAVVRPSFSETATLMKRVNGIIQDDFDTLVRRCDNQEIRKQYLMAKKLGQQPRIDELVAKKKELEVALTENTATLRARQTALSAVKAEIQTLVDALRETRLDSASRLRALQARLVSDIAAKSDAALAVSVLDGVFNTWKNTGNNENTLLQALFAPSVPRPLTDQEKSALGVMETYDSQRNDASEALEDAIAKIAQTNKAIADLKAGRRDSVSELNSKLATKREEARRLIPMVNASRAAVIRTRVALRVNEAQLSATDGMVIPEISPICAKIDSLMTP